MKYTITRSQYSTTYRSPLFDIVIYKQNPRPFLIFSNQSGAAGVYVDRKQIAHLLKEKFKDSVDRRIERSKMILVTI